MSPPDKGSGEQPFEEVHRVEVEARPEDAFAAFSGLGGDTGWLAWDGVWELRAAVDKIFGGPGMNRGGAGDRSANEAIRAGDRLDFWRVEAVEPPRRLYLKAETRLPGDAWLIYEAEELEKDRTRISQTSRFQPDGLSGRLYWLGVSPFHRKVFADMATALGRRAEALAAARKAAGEKTRDPLR